MKEDRTTGYAMSEMDRMCFTVQQYPSFSGSQVHKPQPDSYHEINQLMPNPKSKIENPQSSYLRLPTRHSLLSAFQHLPRVFIDFHLSISKFQHFNRSPGFSGQHSVERLPAGFSQSTGNAIFENIERKVLEEMGSEWRGVERKFDFQKSLSESCHISHGNQRTARSG